MNKTKALPQLQIACCVPITSRRLSPEDAAAAASVFKALGDPTRVQLVNLLVQSGGEVCVCDLNAHFDMAQSTLSFHLKKLLDAGLITRAARGVWSYYSVNKKALGQLRALISGGAS